MITKRQTESSASAREEIRNRVSSGLSGRVEEIEEYEEMFLENVPSLEDDIEMFNDKLEQQSEAVNAILKRYREILYAEGHIAEPMLITRVLEPFMGQPYCEVYPIRGAGAELAGSPLQIVGDVKLINGEMKAGDVALVSKTAKGPKIVDVNATYKRAGQLCTVTDIREDDYFKYELEVEDGRFNNHKICAFKWARLNRNPKIGDKVYANGGAIFEIAKVGGMRGRFAMDITTGLSRSDLRGSEQQRTLTYLLALLDRSISGNGKYPRRSSMFGNDRIMLVGPQGVGKNFIASVFLSLASEQYGAEKILYQLIEGAAIYDSLVGSSQAKLRELREMAIKAVAEGKLPVTHITEAGSALVSRERAGNFLDSGVTHQVVEQLLSMCSGPQEIPGILIIDINGTDSVSRAMKDRFTVFHFNHIGPEVFIDIIKSFYDREVNLFEGEWKTDLLPAVKQALSQHIGDVMIGKEGQVPVTAANVITGRSAKMTIKYAINLLDQSIYMAHREFYEPLNHSITPSLLNYSIVHTAHGLFSTWSLNDARNRLVPDLIKPEKAGSITHPQPIPWNKIKFAPEYDCSSYFDGISCA